MATYRVNSGARTPAAPYTSADWDEAAPDLNTLLQYIKTNNLWAVGDQIWVLDTHAAVYASVITYEFPTTFKVPVLCVNSSGALRPISGSTNYASEITAGASTYSMRFTGHAHHFGILYSAGTNNTSSALEVGSSSLAPTSQTFENCILRVNSTLASTYISFGTHAAGPSTMEFELINTRFQFANSAQTIRLTNGRFIAMRCGTTGATVPANVFDLYNANATIQGGAYNYTSGFVRVNQDESGTLVAHNFVPASGVPFVSGNTVSSTVVGGPVVKIYAASDAAQTWNHYTLSSQGYVETVNDRYLNASVGMTNANGSNVKTSWKMISRGAANCSAFEPLATEWIPFRISSTGTKTVAIKVAYDNPSLWTNMEVRIEVMHMGDDATANTPDIDLSYSGPLLTGAVHPAGGACETRNYFAVSSQLTNTSESWAGSWTALKTATLSRQVTVDQIGTAWARILFSKPDSTLYVDTDVTVS